MIHKPGPIRCRIVLTCDVGRGISAGLFGDILAAGDVAAVILHTASGDSAGFQKEAATLVPVIQHAGVCAIIAADSRVAVRVKADGLHLEGTRQELQDALAEYSPAIIVGCGHLRDRHTAMEAGEMQPDYLLFGKLGRDIKPAPHPRNISLAAWWASIMELPCIVQAGSDLQSIIAATETGAEFVALEEAIFAGDHGPQLLYQANCLLEQHAPQPGEEKQ